MVAATVTKDFGVLASDSAMFDTSNSKMSFIKLKLYYTPLYLVSFIGTPVYFAQMDRSKFGADLPSLVVYMENYLKKIKPEVEKVLRSEIADEDENKPHFCLMILGIHKKLPTLVQFNSFLNFKPKYLYTDKAQPKFSTIMYGDDNPQKKKMFLEATAYMEEKAKKFKDVDFSPGIAGEILTRGIYRKADIEMKLGPQKKYAGGIVNAGCIFKEGNMISLSGVVPA